MPPRPRDGLLQVLRDFRRLIEAVEGLSGVLAAAAEREKSLDPALDRLNALELSRHHFEAEVQGVLLQAKGKLQAANNAEARERQLKKSYERDADPFPVESENGEAAEGNPSPGFDAAASEAKGVQALRLAVAPNNKTLAQRAKWGV